MNWVNFGFLVAVHLVGSVGLCAYWLLHGVTTSALLILAVGVVMTSCSVTLGYHRLFSHRTYETGPVLRFLALVVGAGAFQNTAINWSADHRRHHRHIDTPRDPYNAKRGFFWSHVGWVITRSPLATDAWAVPDLEASRLARWQHRHYVVIGALSGFGLPWLLGWVSGDPWGGLLFGGVLRLLFCYHSTFAINSLAHMFGRQPYSLRNSSRDSWPTALLTMGEGYHNFHHTFPSDYRNGVRWHQFDPSKWLIFALERLGLAWNLKRTPAPAIARARLRVDQQRIDDCGVLPHLESLVQGARRGLDATLSRWSAISRRARAAHRGSELRNQLDAERRVARRSFRLRYRKWQALLGRVELAASQARAPG